MNPPPPTEVVIPSFNGLDRLRRAIAALDREAGAARVCVVDNGSTDGTVESLSAEFPEVRLVALDRNLGFGAAVNRGVASSEATLVVLLNNDAVVEPGFVAAMQSAQATSGAEMVAGCMLDRSGTIETLGAQIDTSLIAYDYLHGRAWQADAHRSSLEPVIGPSGGAALFERAAFSSVGGFDERIFAYLEDVELAIRMRSEGMRLALAPEARAVHEHSSTLGSGSDRKNYLLGWSRGYLLRRHGAAMGRQERLRGALIETVTYAGKAAIDRNLGVIRGRVAAARIDDGRLPTDLVRLPMLDLSVTEALRRRLGRRR